MFSSTEDLRGIASDPADRSELSLRTLVWGWQYQDLLLAHMADKQLAEKGLLCNVCS